MGRGRHIITLNLIGCCLMLVACRGGPEAARAPQGAENREFRDCGQHEVRIRTAFAVGKYEVTRGQYARFVGATRRPDPPQCVAEGGAAGHNWHDPGFAQTDREPVVCIDWDDAQAYVQWLSAQTGRHYRLPSEAEWEYAAQAMPA